MKAIVHKEGRLRWEDVDAPVPCGNEVVLKVMASGINRADLLQVKGLYPAPAGASPILGLECSGRIEGGPVVEDGLYMALVPGGAYAQRVAVDRALLLPVPPGMTPEEAAALPEALYTSYLNLFENGGLSQGESVLITGGSSGIGTIAIQMACAAGARVITTAGDDEKVRKCIQLGAMACVNYRRQDTVSAALEFTNGEGVDLVIDLVGGEGFGDRLQVVRRGGRIALIGLVAGNSARVDLGLALSRNVSIKASTLRSMDIAAKIDLTRKLKEQIMPWVSGGEIRPVIDSIRPVEEAADAHAAMKRGSHFGKMILRIA